MKFFKIKKRNKSIFQSIAEFCIAILVFVVFLLLIPNNTSDNIIKSQTPTTPTTPTMQFIFHDSAEQWEDFFEANELDDVLSWELKDNVIKRLDSDNNDNDNSTIGGIKTWCVLPRFWHTIKNGETVLAYEQRDDVNSICNVERRICDNGVLLWSFKQRSCKENLIYNYTKEPIVTYNQKIIDPLVQPTPPPYIGSKFSIKWKRNEFLVPTTTRNNKSNNAKIREIAGKWQISTDGTYCRTERWEKVENRQFVKAYKSAFGFTNALCEVELRFCKDGQLQGSFDYQYCEPTNMARQDFILQIQDGESPYGDVNVLQLLESLK